MKNRVSSIYGVSSKNMSQTDWNVLPEIKTGIVSITKGNDHESSLKLVTLAIRWQHSNFFFDNVVVHIVVDHYLSMKRDFLKIFFGKVQILSFQIPLVIWQFVNEVGTYGNTSASKNKFLNWMSFRYSLAIRRRVARIRNTKITLTGCGSTAYVSNCEAILRK